MARLVRNQEGEDVVYSVEYYSAIKKKEWNNAICTNMDNLEISMLSEVNQTKTNIIYVEFKKMIQISLFTKQK